MRSLPLLALAACAFASPLTAQRGIFAVFPDDGLLSSFFTDRGVMNAGAAGDALNELPRGLVDGVGQVGGGACQLFGMICVVQDEQAMTQESFSLVARPRAASGTGPDTASVLYRAGPVSTPPGQVGQQAWIVTLAFQTPVTVPCGSDWFHGIGLPVASAWPAQDGLSLQLADYTQGTLGDHPRVGAPNLGWSLDATGAQVQSQPYVWSVALRTSGPSLQVGAVDPANTRTSTAANQGTTTFGVGGFFPDVSGAPRSDGLEVRFYDVQAAGAPTGILFSFAQAPTPLPLPGVLGELRIDVATLVAFPGGVIAPTAPERVIAPFLPPGSLPVSLAGSGAVVWFQGVVLDPGAGPWLTNAVGVQF